MKVLGLTVAAFVLGLAAAVNAATVSQTFTFTGNGTSTASSFQMTSGEVQLTLGAAFYKNPGALNSALVTTGAVNLTRSNSYGLYVNSPNDNDHRIDGFNNEIVTFAFNKTVQITKVTFTEILSGSVFDLYVGSLYKGSQSVVSNLGLSTALGTVFGIGASAGSSPYNYSGFKITSLTVAYDKPVTPVPLPAGGMLLLGGMGALAVLRRRKAKAL